MTELLAPAGDFECAKVALYNGADAIYCACSRFGARAYAKNLSIDELKRLLILAHSMNKRIYVTVNTILKDDELKECIEFVNELYKIGVDGLILADLAIINYVNNNLREMEAHISTQCGVKDLMDVRFFESIGVKRVVLARENSYEEIKNIKQNSDMPLEVFAHGALCVSYSGGCLMSSLLSLRSGNRGRCSQNCRRDYTILKDNQEFAPKASYLSMKDLNTFSSIDKLVNIGVDSVKLEGRMKNPEYVKMITSAYRKKIDDKSYQTDALDKVFHRTYTKGFLFDEDRGQVVDLSKRNRDGELIGSIIERKGSLTKCKLTKPLNTKDRIRIDNGDEDYYFTVDSILDKNNSPVQSGSDIVYLNIYKSFKNGKIYRMIDSSIDLKLDNTYKTPLVIEAIGAVGTPLTLKTSVFGKTYVASSETLLDNAMKRPLDTDTLIKQLAKLNDTSFYLEDVINNIRGDVFMVVSAINDVRRSLIDAIEADMQHSRVLPEINENLNKIDYPQEELTLTAFCTNEEQYNTLRELGIKYIYYKNYSPYVEAKYNYTDENYILAGNYGALYRYKDKEIVSDYSFNVINARAVYELHKQNVKYVTLSLEASLADIKSIYSEYQQYGNNPNLEIVVYGKENLMTTKYCPLKSLGQCGICNKHKYELKDEFGKFPIYHQGCITHIINEKPLNLIDELKEISKYTSRLRLTFTNESREEIIKVVEQFKYRLNNLDSKESLFDSKNNTRGYYKRSIL